MTRYPGAWRSASRRPVALEGRAGGVEGEAVDLDDHALGEPEHVDFVWADVGVPLTAPARTLLDLAEVASRQSIERAFHEAQIRRLLDECPGNAEIAHVESGDAVDSHASFGTRIATRDRDIHRIGSRPKAPEGRSGEMAQDRPRSTCKQSRGLACQRWRHSVTYEIHATVKSMEPVLRDTARNRASTYTQLA
jgi:hypothetical protein